jgi:hypothetical protein
MPHLIVDKDMCPCESGKLIKDCCLRPSWILRPKPFIPKPPLPKTGIKNPKCYATELADCSGKISGEHYVSHSILKVLSDDGVHIDVEGLSWLNGEKKKLPAKRLESNILCTRHNEALSGLDNIAKRFFLSIQRIDKEYAIDINENTDRVFLFNGHDIERWALKTLCGSVFSGNTSHLIAPIKDWKPSLQWLRILFGLENFPKKWGLYVSMNVDEMNEVERSYGFSPVSHKSLGVYGSVTNLNRKKFILSMTDTPLDKTGTILAGYIYRPDELVTTNGKSKKVIRFGWDVRGQGGSITVNLE